MYSESMVRGGIIPHNTSRPVGRFERDGKGGQLKSLARDGIEMVGNREKGSILKVEGGHTLPFQDIVDSARGMVSRRNGVQARKSIRRRHVGYAGVKPKQGVRHADSGTTFDSHHDGAQRRKDSKESCHVAV